MGTTVRFAFFRFFSGRSVRGDATGEIGHGTGEIFEENVSKGPRRGQQGKRPPIAEGVTGLCRERIWKQ